jgi:aminopeptidase C
VTEGWVDLTKNIYDRDMTFDQHFSALLACVPVAADRYRWSHSTVDMDPLEIDPSRDLQDPERWGIRGWNSWGDSWGDRGMFVMKGRLALADLATAPRVLSAA